MPKQILLVDDSVTVHKVVAITFAREDAVLTVVKSADEGIAKAKEIKPDVVLADGGLPGKSGYDLCAALRADPATAGIACLILTGNFSPYDEARGSKAGADGHVVKPFETQAMIDKTNDIINRKRGGASVAAAAPAPSSMPTMAMAAPVLPPAPPKPAAPPPLVPAAPPPLVPAPKPVAAPPAARDEIEISVEPDLPPAKPAAPAPLLQSVPPLVPPAPKPIVAAPPPAPKPVAPAPPKPVSPPAAPQASTMMMEAPKIPAAPMAPPVVSPKEAPQASTMMMEAPKVSAPPPVVKPAPSPTGRMQVTMSASVPQMPRQSLIPGVATPSAAAPAKAAERHRATIMGMPVISGPGNPLVPPAPPKPAVQAWAPPRTTSTGMKAIDPAALGIEMPKPEPAAPVAPIQKEMSPLVAAVTERATAEVDREIIAAGGDPNQLRALSREVIEKIAWEIVPELAETILKENADKLK